MTEARVGLANVQMCRNQNAGPPVSKPGNNAIWTFSAVYPAVF
ncbi:hypothetical protein B4099_1550 [Heyndrickxia coagulans]|uniref:Uncharacterized protein n=1 Tax=Heyndrickxia coagulans TaxID=1398 RepID=A0A150K621_HEYCO|nr:hypothetical protein B4099_1550 [Heyndrickxia coagulans]